MDKYPPLKILVQWREQGKTPEWIYNKCIELANDRMLEMIISGRICEVCGKEPHLARGMGKKCYGKWYYRERVKS